METKQSRKRKARFWLLAFQNKDKEFNFATEIGWQALADGEHLLLI